MKMEKHILIFMVLLPVLNAEEQVKCEPGWVEFNSKCYYFSSDTDYTWTEAASICTDLNSIATLTSVTSQDELDFLLGQELFTDAVFIGGTDAESEGKWTWLDRKPWEYDNFPGGEPSGGASENCLEMVRQAFPQWNRPAGWWNDLRCSEKRGYICSYYNEPTEETPTTLPQITTPVEDCLPGWSQFESKCYKIFEEKKSWDEAQAICQKEGANLATINSSSNNKFVEDLIVKTPVEYPWIGAYLFSSELKEFKWIDGTPFVFENWDKDQPIYNPAESCVEIVNGKWHDFTCGFQRAFICQKTYDYPCCIAKKVGGELYTLKSTDDPAAKDHGCDTTCLYEKNSAPGSRFCFKTGPLEVECTSDGKEAIKENAKIYPGTCEASLRDADCKQGVNNCNSAEGYSPINWYEWGRARCCCKCCTGTGSCGATVC